MIFLLDTNIPPSLKDGITGHEAPIFPGIPTLNANSPDTSYIPQVNVNLPSRAFRD